MTPAIARLTFSGSRAFNSSSLSRWFGNSQRWVCPQCQDRDRQQRRSSATISHDGTFGGSDNTSEEATSSSRWSIKPGWKTIHSVSNRGARTETLCEEVKPQEQFSETVTESDAEELTGAGSLIGFSTDQSALKVTDYKREMPIALRQKDPETAIHAVLAASIDIEYLTTMPAMTFSQILALIDPTYFVAPLEAAYEELSEKRQQTLGLAPLHHLLSDFVRLIRKLIRARRTAGHSLLRQDYSHLLRCADAAGQISFARQLMRLADQKGVKSDIDCYNSMLSAVVNAPLHDPRERHTVRNFAYTKKRRILQRTEPERPGNKGKIWSYRWSTGGIKEQVNSIFNEMLQNRAMPNERSFTLMMTGFAREADISSVEAILKKVWTIDTAALKAKDLSWLSSIKHTSPSSPLRPTQHLLWTVAHVYGTNNDIPTAMALVDSISRAYALTIPTSVWEELFRWTYVLSTPHRGRRWRASLAGQLPPAAPERLFQTFTAEPYNITPTITMYHRLICSYAHRQMTYKMEETITEGKNVWRKTRDRMKQIRRRLEDALDDVEAGIEPEQSLLSLERVYSTAQAAELRDANLVRRWIRLYLSHSVKQRRLPVGYAIHDTPRMLSKFGRFAPKTVRYRTPTGMVEIDHRTLEQRVERKRRFVDTYENASVERFLMRQGVGRVRVKRAREDLTELREEIAVRDALSSASL